MQLDAYFQYIGSKVNDMREAEHWIATCRGTPERFNIICSPWSTYVTDPGLVPSSLDLALLELAEPSLGSCVDRDPPVA